ncbi:unnamed protein product [Pleuronectes platessa]|uniref:Uncharacterized protein n=1 Tax=Pleuronectes platessa TaxID=8262 RepID=A0A9N7Y688_PLEPL|nr:unnamed protein product [Pleuronectes platessa]
MILCRPREQTPLGSLFKPCTARASMAPVCPAPARTSPHQPTPAHPSPHSSPLSMSAFHAFTMMKESRSSRCVVTLNEACSAASDTLQHRAAGQLLPLETKCAPLQPPRAAARGRPTPQCKCPHIAGECVKRTATSYRGIATAAAAAAAPPPWCRILKQQDTVREGEDGTQPGPQR